MPEYLSAGIFIQETSEGARPIAGVATSIAAFVGWTERGRTDSAVLCSNYGDFQREYGKMKRFYIGTTKYEYFNLPLFVQSFIKNGGVRFYVVRLVGAGGAVADYAIANAGATPADLFTVKAKNEGIWGNRISFKLERNAVDNTKWDFTVLYAELPTDTAQVVETYELLVCDDDTSQFYFPDYVNDRSEYVEIQKDTDAPGDPDTEITTAQALSGGLDAVQGDATGLATALEKLDITGQMLMISAPDFWDEADALGAKALIDDADRAGYRFAIINVPSSKTPQEAVTWMTTTLNKNSKRYAV